MKRLALLVAILAMVSIGQAFAQAQRFRAANGGFGTAINAILPGAYHAKIFQKYGLEAEYIALESGTIGMQTLLANEVQVLFTTGALAVTANLQGGDSTIIAGGINFFPFKLIVRPEIKTGAELHGKKLAISRFGSASDYAAQLAIEKLGGDPKQVTMLQLCGNPSPAGCPAFRHRPRHGFQRTLRQRRRQTRYAFASRLGRQRRPLPAKHLHCPPERAGGKAPDGCERDESIDRDALSPQERPRVRS
jgi:ABC-type nitrate/sulfonate/bicarbonate transport system substrate-binding protein